MRVAVDAELALREAGREPRPQLLDEHRPRGPERLLARPDLADDLHAGVLAGGLDGDHAPTGRERAGEGFEHELHLQIGRMPCAEGLGRDDQIVAADRRAGPGDHRVEREPVVGAVEHDHGRVDVDRIAGLRARAHLPPVGQDRAEVVDPAVELVGGASVEGDLAPVDPGPGGFIRRAQRGRLAVVQVGERHHGLGMLGESVGELLQGESHVFEADLLADDEEGHGRVVAVELAQHARHDRAVAGPGVEHPQRGRLRIERFQLGADALADRPLLAARGDEQQVLLPVVEEAEGSFVAGHVGLRGAGVEGGILPISPALFPRPIDRLVGSDSSAFPAPSHAARAIATPAGDPRSRASSHAAIPRFRRLNPSAARIEAV